MLQNACTDSEAPKKAALWGATGASMELAVVTIAAMRSSKKRIFRRLERDQLRGFVGSEVESQDTR